MINYPLVIVEWEDITGNTEPWLVIEDALELEPARMTSVAWMISDKPEYIIISSTIGDKKEVSDINCIPRSAIKSMKVLDG